MRRSWTTPRTASSSPTARATPSSAPQRSPRCAAFWRTKSRPSASAWATRSWRSRPAPTPTSSSSATAARTSPASRTGPSAATSPARTTASRSTPEPCRAGWEPWFTNANDGTERRHPPQAPALLRASSSIPRPRPGRRTPDFLFDALPGEAMPSKMTAARQAAQEGPRPRLAAALKIGQAGEFDYSGSQAIKALKEEGIEVVLVNPNIATIQTRRTWPTQIYFLPVDAGVRRAGHRAGEARRHPAHLRRPDRAQLRRRPWPDRASSKRHGVAVLGTPVEAIEDTEDRELFARRLRRDRRRSRRRAAPPRRVEEALRGGADGSATRSWSASPTPSAARASGCRRDEAELAEAAARRPSPPPPQVLIEEYLGRLEGDRVRGRARPARQLHHRLQHGELRPDGHPHRREHRRRAVPDPDQRASTTSCARSRSRPCGTSASSASATSSSPSTRATATTASSRSTPGSPARPSPPRRPATRWPSSPPSSRSATRCPTSRTGHASDHGLLRAGARLRRGQDPALGPQQVPRRLDAASARR